MNSSSRNPKGVKLSVPEPIGYRKKDTYGCAAIAGTGCLIYVIIGLVAIAGVLIIAMKFMPMILEIIGGGKGWKG